MTDVELILGLLVLVAALALLAHRLGTPYPIVLVLGGLLTGLIPGLPDVELAPDLVFLLFLPPLVYIAAFFTSVRDLRTQARPILSLAIGLVLATTLVVGVVAHGLIPGLGWAAAFALGAIVSPPDSVAAAAIFRRLPVPRVIVTVLEGESLLNDATGLVAYRWQSPPRSPAPFRRAGRPPVPDLWSRRGRRRAGGRLAGGEVAAAAA